VVTTEPVRCPATTGVPADHLTGSYGCHLAVTGWGAHRCSRDLKHGDDKAGHVADHVCRCGHVWITLDGGVASIEYLAEFLTRREREQERSDA
jgi:hypothetical protein